MRTRKEGTLIDVVVCGYDKILRYDSSLFALWKLAVVTIECSNHRLILCANTDGENIAKMERALISDDIGDFLSHEHLFNVEV